MGCVFGLHSFQSLLATFQRVTPFSVLRVLSFLGKASQNVFPSWAFPPKQISRSWGSYLCVFPSLELSESRKKKPKKPVWVCYFSVRDACSEGDVSVHLLVSCKQNRNFWECLKLLSCCGWGLTDNHCQAFTQHSKVTFPLILMSSVHIQALEWEFKGMLTFKSTQSSSLCKGLSGQGWSLWLELQLPVRW